MDMKLEPTLLNLPRASAHRKPNQLILPSCSWVGYPDGTAHHEHHDSYRTGCDLERLKVHMLLIIFVLLTRYTIQYSTPVIKHKRSPSSPQSCAQLSHGSRFFSPHPFKTYVNIYACLIA